MGMRSSRGNLSKIGVNLWENPDNGWQTNAVFPCERSKPGSKIEGCLEVPLDSCLDNF